MRIFHYILYLSLLVGGIIESTKQQSCFVYGESPSQESPVPLENLNSPLAFPKENGNAIHSSIKTAEESPSASELKAQKTPSSFQTPFSTLNLQEEPTIRFRYWLAPRDQIDRWPWGTSKYYPVAGRLFEKWIREFRDQDRSRRQQSVSAGFSKIRLSAHLEGETLANGKGEAVLSPQTVEETPFLMDPCALSLSSLTWETGEQASLGIYPDGLIYLAHPKPQSLRFNWSLRGAYDSAGDLIFSLAFVPSPDTELILDLPLFVSPLPSAGLALRSEESGENGMNRWILRPGSNPQWTLKLTGFQDKKKTEEKTGYTVHSSYFTAPKGIDLVSRFIFESNESPIKKITVTLDSPLLPTAISWKGQTEAPIILNKTKEDSKTVIDIQVPAFDSSPQRELQICAFAPLPSEKTWDIPKIHLESDSIFWKEADLQFTVEKPLIVTDFQLEDASRFFNPYAKPTANQDSFFFRFFEEDAHLTAFFSEIQPEIIFSSGSEIFYGPEEISSQTELSISGNQPGITQITLDISENWKIENVTESASERLEWQLIPKAAGGTKLAISLKKALATTAPRKINITGRYLAELSETTEIQKLSPLDLRNVLQGKHLLALHAEAPYKVTFWDYREKQISPPPLEESLIRETFSQIPEGNIIPLDSSSVGMGIHFDKTNPMYIGNMAGRVSVNQSGIDETWKITCIPTSGVRIDRVIVAFSPDKPQEEALDLPQWSGRLALESDEELQIFPLSEYERRQIKNASKMDLYEVRFSSSHSVPFDFYLSRHREKADSLSIPLLTLPRTKEQTAEIQIDSQDRLPIEIKSIRLRPIVSAIPQHGEFETVIGDFQYTPDELTASPSSPKPNLDLVIFPNQQPNEYAWCHFLRLDSQYVPDGSVRNYITYNIENNGLKWLHIQFPAQIKLSDIFAVWIDEQSVAFHSESDQTSIQIPLPEKKRFISVTLEYRNYRSPLAINPHLTPNIPQLDIPVFSGKWIAWTPPEYASYLSRREWFHPFPVIETFFATLKKTLVSGDLSLWQRMGKHFTGNKKELALAQGKMDLFVTRLGEYGNNRYRIQGEKGVVTGNRQNSPVSGKKTISQTLTWGELFSNPDILTQLFGENEEIPHILINRLAFNQNQILPSQEILFPASLQYAERGISALESAGIVLMVIQPNTLYVTTLNDRENFQDALVPLGSPFICFLKDPLLASKILQTHNPDTISANRWNSESAGIVSPWRQKFYTADAASMISGWNKAETTLELSESGILIANRYRLAAWKWFIFLLAVVGTWKGPLARPLFLVVLIGLVPVLCSFLPPVMAIGLSGAEWGGLISLCFHFVRIYTESRLKKKVENKIISEEPDVFDASEPGFVPPSQIRRFTEENHGSSPSISSFAKESGHVSILFLGLGTLVICLSVLLHSFIGPFVYSAETSAQSLNISPLPTTNAALSSNASDLSEPYRVFVPYDFNQKGSKDDYIWIPEEFYQRLNQLTKNEENLKNPWRFTEARYTGTVNYNNLNQSFSLFHLKAVFTVELETQQAAIRLPMLPLLPDQGAKWDLMPIEPIFDQEKGEIYFNVDRSLPGKHTLELILSPPISVFGSDNIKGMEMVIPRIPDSRLELNIPTDTPPLFVSGALGRVQRSGGKLTAELGPTPRILLRPENTQDSFDQASVEAEQLFLLRAAPNETILKGEFNLHIFHGKLDSLYIQIDPRYVLKRFSCDEIGLAPSWTPNDSSQETTRILFKKSVTGDLKFHAEFQLRDFSGIGQITLPCIHIEGAKITRSRLVLFETPFVEFDHLLPFELASGNFNTNDNMGKPIAVYDLLRTVSNWKTTIRLKNESIQAEEKTTVHFKASEAVINYEEKIKAPTDLFELRFQTPPLFVLKNINLLDHQGKRLPSPHFFSEDGNLYLFFQSPLRGEYVLQMMGTTPSMPDKSQRFPLLFMNDQNKRGMTLEIVYDPVLCLDFTPPVDWALEFSVPSQAQTLPSIIYFGCYQIPSLDDLSTFNIVTRLNRPRVTGDIQTIFFETHQDASAPNETSPNTPVWEILSDFSLNVREGQLNCLELELDENYSDSFSLEPELPYEIEKKEKGRILRIKPTQPIRGEYSFRFRSQTVKLSEMPRVPHLKLTSSEADLANLNHTLFLPSGNKNQNIPYRWDTENLKLIKSADINTSDESKDELKDDRVQNSSILSDNPNEVSQDSSIPTLTQSINETFSSPNIEQKISDDSSMNTFPYNAGDAPQNDVSGQETKTPISQTLINGTLHSNYYFPHRKRNLFPAVVGQLSGLAKDDFLQYKVLGNDYRASIISSENRMRVLGMETNFYLRNNGSFIGESLIDVQTEQDQPIILLFPAEYSILEITANGLPVQPESQGEGRWKISFLQDSNIIHFHLYFSSPQSITEKNLQIAGRRFTQHIFSPPRLEGSILLQSFWTVFFESTADFEYPCHIAQKKREGSHSLRSLSKDIKKIPTGKLEENSDWKKPISFQEGSPILARINFEKMNYLLNLFNQTLHSSQTSKFNLPHWFSRWFIRWQICQNEFLMQASFPAQKNVFTSQQKSAVFQKITDSKHTPIEIAASLKEDEPPLEMDFFLRYVSEKDYQEITDRYKALLSEAGLTEEANALTSQNADAFSLWSLKNLNNSQKEGTFLLGLTNTETDLIEILTPNSKQHYYQRLIMKGTIRFAFIFFIIFFIWKIEFRRWVACHFISLILLIILGLFCLSPSLGKFILFLILAGYKLYVLKRKKKFPFSHFSFSRKKKGNLTPSSEETVPRQPLETASAPLEEKEKTPETLRESISREKE